MNNKRTLFYQAVLALVPLIYLGIIWNSLPARVPTHSDINLKVDTYGDKTEILYLIMGLFAITVLTSLLVIRIHKLDPNMRDAEPPRANLNISWIVTIVLTLVSLCVVLDTEGKTNNPPRTFLSIKLINSLIALLFCLIGNYIKNIKPNYFVGIRTPWTLQSSETWKRTHQLGSKFTFWSGLVMLILILSLPSLAGTIVLLLGIALIIFVLVYYSYTVFVKLKEQHIH